jgi:hypothetical protein
MQNLKEPIEGFRLEPIKQVQTYETVAYDMLFQSDVPNHILFYRENPELDCYILNRVSEIKERIPDDKMCILNISMAAVEKYFGFLLGLPDNFYFDVCSSCFLSNDENLKKLRALRHKIFIDGYGIGNGNLETIKRIEPRGVKFDRVMLQYSDADIRRHHDNVLNHTDMVIAKKIENMGELDRVRGIFQYVHGYVFFSS